jgi:hypothetical protein
MRFLRDNVQAASKDDFLSGANLEPSELELLTILNLL